MFQREKGGYRRVDFRDVTVKEVKRSLVVLGEQTHLRKHGMEGGEVVMAR